MTDKTTYVLKRSGLFILSFGLIFWALLLVNKPNQQSKEKTELSIETTTPVDLYQPLQISKPGKVVANQDILVTAQANGRVSRIAYKEGENVKGGQPIIVLADTVAQYALQTQRAKNSLDRALLIKKEAELNLGQQLLQAENAYRSAQQAFEFAQTTTQNTLKQAQLGLTSAQSQIEALKEQFQGQKLAILGLMTAIIEASDKWLGVTHFYQDQQTGYEVYLGAKDQSHLNLTREALRNLYTEREKVQKLNAVPQNDQELRDATATLAKIYDEIASFAWMMVEVMRNSIASEGTLSQSTIDANIQAFQAFQVGQALLVPKTSFIAYANQVNAQLLWTGTLAQDNAQIGYDTALASSQNTLFNSEIAVKNAQVAYETFKLNQQTQLSLLDNAIADAKIAYENALNQYAKLTIRTPISGVIAQVLVSEGQEIAVGTPVFKISAQKQQQIEVYVTATEYPYIQKDEPVRITYQGQSFTGNIDAMSTVADQTNLFKITVQLTFDGMLLGEIAQIDFPITIDPQRILPLDKIKILADNQGTVVIMSGDELVELPVEIKTTWGKYAELMTPLDQKLQLLKTDLSTLDTNAYELKALWVMDSKS